MLFFGIPSLAVPLPHYLFKMMCRRLHPFLATAAFLISQVISLATTDSWRDADLGQSSYVGGTYNLDPTVVDSPQFGEVWKVDFDVNEKVSLFYFRDTFRWLKAS